MRRIWMKVVSFGTQEGFVCSFSFLLSDKVCTLLSRLSSSLIGQLTQITLE